MIEAPGSKENMGHPRNWEHIRMTSAALGMSQSGREKVDT